MEDYKYQLACKIEDIQHDMAVLSLDLCKSYARVAACRRARVLSVKLAKDLKDFRRISCLAGMK